MKAAVFHTPKEPLKIEEVPTPSPAEGEILVKVAACGLCHTDLGYIDHGVPTFKKPPLILGHEVSGTVAIVGSGVKGWEEDQPVLLPAVYGCKTCNNCRNGRENICERMIMFGNNIDGGYAEYVIAPPPTSSPYRTRSPWWKAQSSRTRSPRPTTRSSTAGRSNPATRWSCLAAVASG